jgi:penicillin-insensitive murein endopeptidase
MTWVRMPRRVLALILAFVAPQVHATSVGKVEDGNIEEAAELPVKGQHHYILPQRHRWRGLRFATRDLVELLLHTARAVARMHAGSRLGVGNLSRRKGGPIPFSRSHQSGRDADLAFFVVDRRGQPQSPRDFVRFDHRGRGPGGLRFDVARNWTLIEALLTAPGARVQWLLIHRSLRRRLLRYALRSGAPAEVVRRAEKVMHQPRWALPHNDHLHVRIYCPAAHVARGCVDTGPVWPWIAAEEKARPESGAGR